MTNTMSDFSNKNSFSATFGTFYNLSGDYKIIRKDSFTEFPSVGNEKYLYVANDTNLMYFWDDKNNTFVSAKTDGSVAFPDVLKINGGNAGSIYEENE